MVKGLEVLGSCITCLPAVDQQQQVGQRHLLEMSENRRVTVCSCSEGRAGLKSSR
jgi:hypothetical protein